MSVHYKFVATFCVCTILVAGWGCAHERAGMKTNSAEEITADLPLEYVPMSTETGKISGAIFGVLQAVERYRASKDSDNRRPGVERFDIYVYPKEAWQVAQPWRWKVGYVARNESRTGSSAGPDADVTYFVDQQGQVLGSSNEQ